VASQMVTVIVGWILANAQFPVWLPFGQLVRCILAIVPMSVALIVIRFPLDWFGLFAAILMGAATYFVSAIALDVGQVRSIGHEMLRKRMRRKMPALTEVDISA
jgi:hypothetical protein